MISPWYGLAREISKFYFPVPVGPTITNSLFME